MQTVTGGGAPEVAVRLVSLTQCHLLHGCLCILKRDLKLLKCLEQSHLIRFLKTCSISVVPRRVFRANVGTGEKGKVEVQQCPDGCHSTWVGGGCPSVLRMAEQSRDWYGWNLRTPSLWPQAATSLAAQFSSVQLLNHVRLFATP